MSGGMMENRLKETRSDLISKIESYERILEEADNSDSVYITGWLLITARAALRELDEQMAERVSDEWKHENES